MSSVSVLEPHSDTDDVQSPSRQIVIAVADLLVSGSVRIRTLAWFDGFVPFKDLRRVAMDNDNTMICVLDLDLWLTDMFSVDRAIAIVGANSVDDFTAWNAVAVLRQAVHEVRDHGYFSRKDADTFKTDATADRVNHAMQSRLPPIPHDAEEESHVAAILSMIDGFDTAKDFNLKVKEAVNGGVVDSRDIGLIVSVVGRYFQDLVQDTSIPVGTWIGNVGDLVDVEVVVVSEQQVQTKYGVSYPTKLRSGSGDKVTLWNKKPTGLQRGDLIRLKGIVSECGIWRGRRETTVKEFVFDVISHASLSMIQDQNDDSFY